jgi:hypothetical protein
VTQSTDMVPAGTYDTGLDDLTPADLVVPRLRIKHKDGVFEDSATGEQIPKLVCVILGLVRQRTLFHHNVEDDDLPMCKSPDYQIGYPNLNPAKSTKAFPWELAQLNPADFPPQEDGTTMLPCENCNLKTWGTHPLGDKPYCAEQHTLPLYYAPSIEQLRAGEFAAALISLQKTSIPPSKRYLGTFKQKGVGAYTAITEISLNQQRRGQTDFCVPIFKRLGDTDPENWPEYSEHYAGIRAFLVSARPGGPRSDSSNTPAATPTAGPAATSTPTASVVQSNTPQVFTPSTDDLPF